MLKNILAVCGIVALIIFCYIGYIVIIGVAAMDHANGYYNWFNKLLFGRN